MVRAVLDTDDAHLRVHRRVWIADSFRGIPPPRSEKGVRVDDTKEWSERYAYPQEAVRSVFRRYNLLDDRVRFIPGWFNESLRGVRELTRISVLHVDVDSYDSVIDVLDALYEKVSIGGYVIIDDYGLSGVRTAISDFWSKHMIREVLLPVPSDHMTTCRADFTHRARNTEMRGSERAKRYDLVTPLSAAFWEKTVAIRKG